MEVPFYPMKTGFKVCRQTRWSLIPSFDDGRICEYKRDEWTVPCEGDGPLAVFNERIDAHNFLRDFGLTKLIYKIKRCLYVPSSEGLGLWFITKNSGRIYMPARYLPKGSKLADAVMLVE